MKSRSRSTPPTRSTYRHGDLRRALLEAGIALARSGGPDSVTLREATRRAGVVPNAAYRHFASHGALLQAVRAAALASLAKAMEGELATLDHDQPAADLARAGVRAIGAAYLRFAQAEPGLFRAAFAVPGDAAFAALSKAGKSGLDPFQLLGAALDRLVTAGVMPPERRAEAEYLAWSAVHGLAMLILEGPLRGIAPERARELGGQLLEMVERGLSKPVEESPCARQHRVGHET